MGMTKQDFELVAETLKDSHETTCREFADELSRQNPRFDSGMFMDACMGDE